MRSNDDVISVVPPTLIALDVEATCWDYETFRDPREIIEVGAVKIDRSTGQCVDEFAMFVKPSANSVLNDFCISLTGIQQDKISSAESWPSVFLSLRQFCGGQEFYWFTFGQFDRQIIEAESIRHGCADEDFIARHRNLKSILPPLLGCSKSMLAPYLERRIGAQAEVRHRALPDARYAAKAVIELILGGDGSARP